MPVSANDFLTSRGTATATLFYSGTLSLGSQIGAGYKPYLVSGDTNAVMWLDTDTPPSGVSITARYFILSVWLNVGGPGVWFPFQNNATPGITVGAFSSSLVHFIDASFNTSLLNYALNAFGPVVLPGLNHLLVSCDTQAGTYEAVVNGTTLPPSGPPQDVITDFTIDNSGGLYLIQPDDPADTFTELWFDFPASYQGAAANLAKFYNGGNPVDPGADGSVPFGAKPAGYFTVRDAAGPPPDFPLPVGVIKVLLPPAELQFCDANGHPFAAGTLEMYQPNSSTPKDTWNDPAGGDDHLNSNPIVLDSAGRALIYGDGAYRTVLRDAAGNLIWDQPSFTYVSACMVPVVGAADLATARDAMGITDAIEAEATARAAADSAEATARAAADATLTTNLAAEVARAEAAEAHLQSEIDALPPPASPGNVQGGSAQLDAAGYHHVTFPTPFATACDSFVVTGAAVGVWSGAFNVANQTTTGIDVWGSIFGSRTPAANVVFFWQATGH